MRDHFWPINALGFGLGMLMYIEYTQRTSPFLPITRLKIDPV